LGDLSEEKKIQRLIKISNGWYCIVQENEQLYFNDLRFGLMSMDASEENFVFSYKVEEKNNEITITEKPKNPEDATKLIYGLWDRIRGN